MQTGVAKKNAVNDCLNGPFCRIEDRVEQAKTHKNSKDASCFFLVTEENGVKCIVRRLLYTPGKLFIGLPELCHAFYIFPSWCAKYRIVIYFLPFGCLRGNLITDNMEVFKTLDRIVFLRGLFNMVKVVPLVCQ
jgi:hypothetical protein